MLPWADDRGEVLVVDFHRNHALLLRTSNATIIKNAYKTSVLSHDREGHYAGIESRGITAIRDIRLGTPIDKVRRHDVTEFMDMFVERGLYADRAGLKVPVIRGSFDSHEIEETEFRLGDMIALHRDLHPDEPTLAALGVAHWDWTTVRLETPTVTGDGAVVPIGSGGRITTVLFPLDPFTLLVVGEIPHDLKLSMSDAIMTASRRWVIARPQDASADVLEELSKKRTRSRHN